MNNCLCVCHMIGPVWTTDTRCHCDCWSKYKRGFIPYEANGKLPEFSPPSKENPPFLIKLADQDKKILAELDKLNEHKNRQIDENRKASKRIDELEAAQKEQLNKLAEFNIALNKMRSECREILKQAQKKVPYKCPVCDGKPRFRQEPVYSVTCSQNPIDQRHLCPVEWNCHACAGKGIVWG